MHCQKCEQRPATVRITKIVNGEKSELHLCQECAAEMQGEAMNWETEFPFNLLSSLFEEVEPGIGFAKSKTQVPTKCKTCGQTYHSFRRTGKLGCGNCYDTFNAQLSPIIRRIHGNERHTGKIPTRGGKRLKLQKDIASLKREMQSLVQKEEFEKAAEVRDKIRELENTE
ncbi:UvrB/UvrC motif-containing protein [Metallumcola ferriviriculae]|uniref:UvrB/UvrC motif-containing protein n=1 Tax=Metallumcola ferriviriculae TaxID=3039180 RepID=A0AAU0UJC6_9FIRM|nr:UvrB/UvrC motif-containing protein [Desulfitibacteraceae bacterium MK1]